RGRLPEADGGYAFRFHRPLAQPARGAPAHHRRAGHERGHHIRAQRRQPLRHRAQTPQAHRASGHRAAHPAVGRGVPAHHAMDLHGGGARAHGARRHADGAGARHRPARQPRRLRLHREPDARALLHPAHRARTRHYAQRRAGVALLRRRGDHPSPPARARGSERLPRPRRGAGGRAERQRQRALRGHHAGGGPRARGRAAELRMPAGLPRLRVRPGRRRARLQRGGIHHVERQAHRGRGRHSRRGRAAYAGGPARGARPHARARAGAGAYGGAARTMSAHGKSRRVAAPALNPGVAKREVAAWAMYDFANSGYTTVVLTAVFNAYFVSVVAGNAPWATFAWTAALAVSYALVIVAGPILGAWADAHAAKKQVLAWSTAVCIAGTVALAWCGPGTVAWAATFIVVSNFAYSMGENLCAAFLPELARPEALGKVSGWGWSLGYFGGILGLGLCLGWVMTAASRGSTTSEAVGGTMFITAAVYALAALPTFLFLRERARPTQ